MSTTDIYAITCESLLATSMLRFSIIAIIGDGAQCNRQFQNSFFNEKVLGLEKKVFENILTRQPIFYISNPSHIVKKIVSSLSSKNRYIFITVMGYDRNLSLSNMMTLWMLFNSNSGLNQHQDFKMTDSIKITFKQCELGHI